MKEAVKDVVTMRELLECGVHFGHQTKRWNPKMKKYIFTSRNGIHVIDLQQSLQLINVAFEFVKEVSRNNGSILFVGTKKQAQDTIKEESQRCQMPFVNHRWLGGTLTNISTIRQSINKLKDFEKKQDQGDIDQLSGKEKSKKTKAYNKLFYNLEGIKDMIKIPSALFVVDTKKEQLAVQEAHRLGIPIIGIIDTNANPNEVDYPIPANDDAIRAVRLLCSVMANAVLEGQKEALESAAKQSAEEEAKQEEAKQEKKEVETKKEEEKNTPVKKPAVAKKEEEKKAPAKKPAVAKKEEKKKAPEKKPAVAKKETEKKAPAKKSAPKAKKTDDKK